MTIDADGFYARPCLVGHQMDAQIQDLADKSASFQDFVLTNFLPHAPLNNMQKSQVTLCFILPDLSAGPCRSVISMYRA